MRWETMGKSEAGERPKLILILLASPGCCVVNILRKAKGWSRKTHKESYNNPVRGDGGLDQVVRVEGTGVLGRASMVCWWVEDKTSRFDSKWWHHWWIWRTWRQSNLGRNQQLNLECVLSEAPATIQAGDKPGLINFHVSIATLLRSISEDAYKTQVCGASSTLLNPSSEEETGNSYFKQVLKKSW